MKPVAIFRHTKSEGPAYFATFLDSHRIPWQLIAIDTGEPVPLSADAFSGLCLMGGPMSVNDPLPWIAPLCALIRDADRLGRPVIGHCLGGQLMSKAFGGQITRSPVKEIGWGTVKIDAGTQCKHWLGETLLADHGEATVFQWHGETFSLPPDTQRFFTNAYCANQAFVRGPHLALQCHVEMTAELIEAWCDDWAKEVAGLAHPLPPCVQKPETMFEEIDVKLPAMRRLADQLYAAWISGLKD